MTITISLEDSVLAGLGQQAERQHVSVEELAVKILETAAEESTIESLEDVVARIKATPPKLGELCQSGESLNDSQIDQILYGQLDVNVSNA